MFNLADISSLANIARNNLCNNLLRTAFVFSKAVTVVAQSPSNNTDSLQSPSSDLKKLLPFIITLISAACLGGVVVGTAYYWERNCRNKPATERSSCCLPRRIKPIGNTIV